MSRSENVGEPFIHQPVMVSEILELFAPLPPGVVVDATVGGGGHAAAILSAQPGLSLVGLDQDASAIAASRRRLASFGSRATVVRSRFDRLGSVLSDLGIVDVVGVLFDLGVSSPQLERAERGFSYRLDGEIDMRMDQDRAGTAADLVNTASKSELADLFAANGESRFAGRIAGAIIAARPLATTTQLADVVRDAIPMAARRTGGHPARRVFQALRIATNDELEILPTALRAGLESLAPGGRMIILSYHSGEDRIAKAVLRRAESGGCACPPGFPCVCGAVPTVRLLRRGALKPSAAEVASNHRAESARLRVAERLQP